ncbi:DNA polymerase III subunit delta [Eubacteriales bacterium OttesenSCG-928-N14]|nr:DNA polymerase III subunit delta [Eubacteriales bacterium OttesenSCG-928-N14]
MNYTQFNQQVKDGKLQSVYLFVGEEQFVKARCLSRLIDAAIGDGPAELNVSRFDESALADDVIAACLNMPLFANKRVVIYRDCPMLKATGKDTGEAALLEYIKQPAEDAVLVFYMQDKADSRKALTKAIGKDAKVEFTQLSDADIHRFLSVDAKQRGLMVTRGAIERLIAYSGKDMSTLVNEMDKAVAYAYPATTIDETAIEAICTRTIEAEAFAIVDDLVAGRIQKAQRQLDELLQDAGATQALFGAIAYRLRMVLSAREALDAGKSQKDAAKQIKGHPFVVNKAFADARRFSAARLRQGLAALAEADAAIKSGRMRERVALNHALSKTFGI